MHTCKLLQQIAVVIIPHVCNIVFCVTVISSPHHHIILQVPGHKQKAQTQKHGCI